MGRASVGTAEGWEKRAQIRRYPVREIGIGLHVQIDHLTFKARLSSTGERLCRTSHGSQLSPALGRDDCSGTLHVLVARGRNRGTVEFERPRLSKFFIEFCLLFSTVPDAGAVNERVAACFPRAGIVFWLADGDFHMPARYSEQVSPYLNRIATIQCCSLSEFLFAQSRSSRICSPKIFAV